MGIHGNSTCLLNYDGRPAGWSASREKGLAAMFIMMNAARLGVGLQGLAQGEVAYQNAVAYAKDRRQGRALVPDEREPDAKADPIIVHPDVRRMLMEAKAFNEARPRARPVGRAPGRYRPQGADRGGARGGRRPARPAHPGDQGLSHRQGLRGRGQRPADLWRPRLYPRMGHGAVRPRRPHRPDLRRHQRHPGARPGRPQARRQDGGRAIQAFFKLVGEEVAAAKGDEQTRRARRGARARQSATFRPRRCG